MGKTTKKVRSYRAVFENGAEYRFFATSYETAEDVAESRAIELETKVKELIECTENGVEPCNKEAETPQEEHEEPWYGSRIVAINGQPYVKARYEFDPPEVAEKVAEAIKDANIPGLTIKSVEPTEKSCSAFEICFNANGMEVLQIAQGLMHVKELAKIVYAKKEWILNVVTDAIEAELFGRRRS